jgi:COX assembly protein 1
MNGCMIAHATREEQDAAREEWFSKRDERRADLEDEARKTAEANMIRDDWWADYRNRQQGGETK